MNAMSRFSDVINSNINAILEKAEDPQKMIKFAVQETQNTLVDIRAASARYMADQKAINKRLAHARRQVSEWQDKAELSITHGRDDLAKAAIVERNTAEAAVTALEGELIHIDDATTKLKADAVRLEDKLKEAKSRQKALVLRGQTAKSRIRVKRQLHDVNYDAAMDRFESYERKLDELEGISESYDIGNGSLSDEITRLANDSHLDHELDQLKARIVGTGSISPAPVQPQTAARVQSDS